MSTLYVHFPTPWNWHHVYHIPRAKVGAVAVLFYGATKKRPCFLKNNIKQPQDLRPSSFQQKMNNKPIFIFSNSIYFFVQVQGCKKKKKKKTAKFPPSDESLQWQVQQLLVQRREILPFFSVYIRVYKRYFLVIFNKNLLVRLRQKSKLVISPSGQS